MPQTRPILVHLLFTSLLVLSVITGDWRSIGGAAQSGERPLALATGDFDEDGVADLLSGYAVGEDGSIKWHRGSVAAVYPNSPEARRSGAGDDPFLAATTQAATTLPLPTTLAGVSVTVKNSLGDERLAPLFFIFAGNRATMAGCATFSKER